MLAIIIIIGLSLIGGQLARKVGLPVVVGQLLTGIVIGPAIFNIVQTTHWVHLLAELGVWLLMFMAGLETDMAGLQKNAKPAVGVAILGVIIPLIVFYVTAWFFGYSQMTAVFFGIVFSATSISITIAVLGEFGKLGSRAGNIILGAAVLDDILAMALVGFFMIFTPGQGLGPTTLLPIVFFVVGILINRFTKINFQMVEKIGNWTLIPLFFGSLGLVVTFDNLAKNWPMVIAFAVFALGTKYYGALIGSRITGVNPNDSQVVALGMIPRGEMALIIAQIGITGGVINAAIFSDMVIIILISTVIPPILLRYALKKV